MKKLTLLIILLLLVGACVVGGDKTPAPETRLIKECLIGTGRYCSVMQITDPDTGCVTVVGKISNFAKETKQTVDISCPWNNE